MAAYKSRFGELLREAREKAAQTADVMAILLNMSLENYTAIESGAKVPDDDTVKRLCMMMEWNYLETTRLIRNDTSSSSRAIALSAAQTPADSLHGHPLNPDGTPGSGMAESLGARMKEVRLLTGQSMEIIGALLNIGADGYQRLEEGEAPNDELLRRISMIYNWNYYDLKAILRSEQAQQLQPRRVGNPFPNTSVRVDRLRNLWREIEAVFGAAPEPEQEMMLAQLELIRATLSRGRRLDHHLPSSQMPAPSGAVPQDAPVAPTTHRRKSSMSPSLPGMSDRKIFPS